MKDKAIPLTKAAYKKQFSDAMINNGLSPEYYFKKVGLPAHQQENPENLLPVKPFWHLLNLVAMDAGIADFGAQVAESTPWHEIDSLKPLIKKCSTLEDLLQSFCKAAPTQNNQAICNAELNDSELWFTYSGALLMNNDIQMELYRMTGMIQLVQLATGSDWFPEYIELMMPATGIVKACRLISKSRIIFSQARSGFPIPETLLKLPVNLQIAVTKQATATHHYDINADFVPVIRQLIGIFISNKDCSIDEISRVTDIPIRTLQRRLKSHDTCFKDLLNQAKFSLAKDKLENPATTMMEISYQLGYSDPAHFSHAFQRWAGMSPSQFRASIR